MSLLSYSKKCVNRPPKSLDSVRLTCLCDTPCPFHQVLIDDNDDNNTEVSLLCRAQTRVRVLVVQISYNSSC